MKIKWFYRWEFFLLLLFIVEIAIFGWISPGFLHVNNLLFSMNDFMFISIAAIPMTLVIISGGIDVSIGSIMGLCSIILGVSWSHGVNVWLAVIIAIFCGLAAGLFNGLIILYSRVQPLVVTLGSMFLFSGLALVISGGSKASGYEGISGFPDAFVQLGNGSFLGVPNPVWFLFVMTAAFCTLLHFMKYGRSVYLVGINSKAALYSGLRIKWISLSTYILSGLGGGLSGILLTSYFSSARADLGSEAVLPVITAVVLGGTSIIGGRGSIAGTVLASIVIGFMQYGLQAIGLTSEQASIVIGAMLILSVMARQSSFQKVMQWFRQRKSNSSDLMY
ncbi:autoinducer 2 import system permease LsrD [Fictibacillus sp. CENA-BCM004]|uniref:Autoinducer 2 import system permease protein LsrD n=1 Tax=Fictibacillus terranigra TaxID=3058424 RepID=A0ABT8E848_9BACL|nr:autoinducer 2 import system permease LsrD [Fictibacillus sp. CENA-BCM004]MDN4074044.1 autoinducer 2 import system permease LsrD [Fictibacillus sp. CENA-BCM004]